ncbi:MAG TPA: DUF6504 family protein [Allosphingosinicella sp.]|nr:DUF6504 family protein [Allosphingosinicella sp.]
MRRVASLYLPYLPTERLKRLAARSGQPLPDHSAVVTAHRAGQQIIIAAVSPAALAAGLTPGIALTQARALVPDIDVLAADPEGDAALLTRLAVHAARSWTPRAAIADASGLWLDISGCAHLFGGERAMAEKILSFCARLGFTARLAIVDTVGAAHALARYGSSSLSLCPPGEQSKAIAPLPLAALRIDEKVESAARRLGIETIGQLAAMPRAPIERRFGKTLLKRLDQALGRAAEPIRPIIPEEAPCASLNFLEPIATAEAIEQVISDLLLKLIRLLNLKGLGARSLELHCDRVDGKTQSFTIGTATANSERDYLLRLFRLKVDQIEPGFGIERMRLVARSCEPLHPRQLVSAFGPDEEAPNLVRVVDCLANRLGQERVFRLSRVESDVPERSVERRGPMAPLHDWPAEWPRPVHLLPTPERVEKVMAELPDQPPRRFQWRGRMHRVRKADGPERIHGEWWKRAAEAEALRDYFRVEDEAGERFWIFRRGDGTDPRTGDLSWYVHGVFG